MEQHLVSVVIPFYSGLNWLKEALTSVVNQTYENIEVLVINDGSKEDINAVAEIYGHDVKIINKANGGPASARNLGIEKASGKYIAFLDSDDLWLPDKLTNQISEMELNDYVWSQHSYEMFWNNSDKTKVVNTKIYHGYVYRDCFISFKIQTSCVVVLRKTLIENNIIFPLERRYGQDGAFYQQIAKSYPLGCIEGVYSKFRIRGSNAGFRAKVQIDSKALTWEEIKKKKDVLIILPDLIIFSYRVSYVFSKWVNYINRKFVKEDKHIELLSKVMYAFPYALFKIYARRN